MGINSQLAILRRLSFIYKKARLSLTNPRDAKACQNCSNSTPVSWKVH